MSSPGRESVGTVEDLHASASKVTGLEDFGDGDYRDGLQVLLDSYAGEAALTPLGNKVMRSFVRGALMARLLSESAWQQHPEYAQTPIQRPVFVTGLPRTGTTALHRLLTADPAHQGPELWLTEVPQPRPPRETWEENPIFAAIQAGYRQHHVEHPEFMGVHYTSAEQVEECWQLLRQSMRSVSFECLAHIPTYSLWLQGQDWTEAYQRHRRNLELIGLPDQEKRWVLKNPSHLFALNALLAVYPDALVIQTHRSPRVAIASVCSLNGQASQGWSEVYQGEVVGRDQLDLWARGLDQFTADRAKHDSSYFVDVQYDDFVADPMAVVETIYARLGTPLSDEARTAMTDLHAESRSGERRPAHRYELANFGLTGEQVDERFAAYL
ncbi:MAG TPA: sulfotransferase family protein [Micromonosporaceae bacterium]|nr:sulfotransferase family protein [Micromonosporaceae bacterium]HCU50512.1 sulfotransferase family protein [Micromonosporaceae bacterium]